MNRRRLSVAFLALGGLLAAGSVAAARGIVVPTIEQAQRTIAIEPAELTLRSGETVRLAADVRDARGEPLRDVEIVFLSTAPAAVSVTQEGEVTGHLPGEYELVVLAPAQLDVAPDLVEETAPGLRRTVRVRVTPSALARLEIGGLPDIVYAGTTIPLTATAIDESGAAADVRPSFSASDPAVAIVDGFGELFEGSRNAHTFYRRERPTTFPGDTAALFSALKPGTVTIRAESDGVVGTVDVTVEPNPVGSLSLAASRAQARTGDVVQLDVSGRDGQGRELSSPPVRFAIVARPDAGNAASVGAGAAAQVLPDGRFVAEQPGLYTVIANSGDAVAQTTISVVERDVQREIEFVGHARINDSPTSDLWVWEGVDGRDYAALGSWNGAGNAYFFDVTDPTDMRLIDTVQVDARTVNDVKISEDGRIGVITREGASNRRNGLVILDVSDPHNVEILSTFDDELTGGVHNVFLYQDHVFAINNGRRWDVINVEDPTNPTRVARFEAQGARRSVHDVWVRDGIALQAGNTDGLIVVDVGGGAAGGSPTNPVEIGRMPQLTGWNHAVWPFRSRSTGKFYVVGGDEAHPTNPRNPGPIISWEERVPSRAMGWIHFVEFDDLDEPREVARYRVPDAGPHNLWIDPDNEIMYVAYFNGGLRVVDVSGDLVGDLYRQGREIARFFSDDREGFVPNAPFVWGPQPHKGTIFFSDFHSGLWAVRIAPDE